MELAIFVTGIIVLIAFLVYVFIQGQHDRHDQSLILLKMELAESRAAEQRFREELDILQNRLQQTFTDPVTHLLGWRLFEDRLEQAVKESVRNHVSFSVVYIYLDNYHMINNALGYEVGNLLLQEIAQRLQACIRQVDSASRFSKDTFILLLAQLTKPETTILITQRLLQAFAPSFQINNHDLFITVSMGIAVYPLDGEDAPTLLRNAEQALLTAKEMSGNSYQFYQPKLQMGSQQELALYTHLHQESLFQELQLFYRPIMDVSIDAVFCMDTDLRWLNTELGLIEQHELFEYATKQRKLNTISEWLLRRAVKQFVHWRSLGFSPECLGMTFMMSQLENSHFIYSISQILQENQCQPEWLLLKIAGDFTRTSADVLEKSFNRLKYLKIKTALLEYDSGSFSLRQLKLFPVQYLVLSRLSIEDISNNPETLALIKAIVFLAQTLSMQLIAQEVESELEVNVLKEIGCTLMQGVIINKPLPENEVTVKMATIA